VSQTIPESPAANGEANGDFKQAIAKRATELLLELKEATTVREEAEARVEKKLREIELLNPLLALHGINEIPIGESSPGRQQTARQASPIPFARGNRSKDMPARQPEFGGMSLRDTIKAVLERGDSWETDNIIRAVYVVLELEDLRRARETIASELSNGVTKGLWERVRRGVYQAKRGST
jgi:hypothetical protein